LIEVEVGLEKWIKADIRPKSQPVIGVNEVGVIPMHDVNIPAHKAHLQP
jgi:hypothetical protein